MLKSEGDSGESICIRGDDGIFHNNNKNSLILKSGTSKTDSDLKIQPLDEIFLHSYLTTFQILFFHLTSSNLFCDFLFVWLVLALFFDGYIF